MSFKYELGSKAKDKITGYVGMIIARTEWLYGCRRYSLQSQEMKDGKPVDSLGIDEDAIELINPARPHVMHDRGGPRETPSRRPDARR